MCSCNHEQLDVTDTGYVVLHSRIKITLTQHCSGQVSYNNINNHN